MEKFFNTAGLCFPGKHYMIDPLKRLREIEQLITREFYFTIHAPRQTGKTTCLYALAKKLNAEGKYIALVASFERAGFGSITLEKANETLIDSIYKASQRQLPEQDQPPMSSGKIYLDLNDYLTEWSGSQSKPIVLLIDEIDALLDDVLISVLRQLRDGYQARPKAFPSSIALVGLRDVRDYKAIIRPNAESMGTASPFNIKAESIFLNNFNQQDVFNLLKQHTIATGQVFPDDVKKEIFNLTNGQPWLVNAIANQIVAKILKDDYSKKITLEIVTKAKNQLIQRRDTHLDSLLDKLKEKRVRRVVQAIINGDFLPSDKLNDDTSYVRDLGIASHSNPLEFSNPIYAEIIPRVMASPIEESIPKEIHSQWFVNEQNELDIKKLLLAFQEFYSENADFWLDRFAFKESANHLLLMAFLQRVVNAGGDIIREMAVGNHRIDLLIKYNEQKIAMELKIWNGARSIEKAKKQLDRYLDKFGLKEGYLVIFDPRELDWNEKLYWKEIKYNNKKINMVGL